MTVGFRSVSQLRFTHLGADDYIRTRLPTKQRARRTFQNGLLSISVPIRIRAYLRNQPTTVQFCDLAPTNATADHRLST